MLVLNDVHVQTSYAAGSNKNCREQTGCCTARSGFPSKLIDQAQYWGSPLAQCDLPPVSFDSAIKQIIDTHPDIDVIGLLGDYAGHDYFYKDKTYLSNTTALVFDAIKKAYPNTTTVPVLGNHECDPANSLNFNDENNFVNTNIFPLFEKFITPEKVKDLKTQGFFEIEMPQFNLRLLSFNSQLNDLFNEYLILNATNPLGVLDRLADAFYRAERLGQKIIILAHFPISDPYTHPTFNKCFKAILNRFRSTITTMFSGHTHYDHVKFIRSKEGEIIAINYITPSLTPYSSYRPSYRIYEIQNGDVIDYAQFNVDIDRANSLARIGIYSFIFETAYTFR